VAKKLIKQMRDFPSVEELLQEKKLSGGSLALPRPLVAEITKQVVAEQKKLFKEKNEETTVARLVDAVMKEARRFKRSEISRVVNATGIVVHTNLGRAPLSDDLFDAIKKTVTGYGNIEFDMARGVRGKRGEACEKYLALLSGAEAGTVVNNCAAALFIILNTLANRKEVVISRGELVQIGGGFRIPDILRKSGARLAEVGATNITTIDDYESGLNDRTALILKVHQSNFVQRGFTAEVSLKDMVALGKKHNLPVIDDLGSGVFVPTRDILGYAEPTVQQSVRDGATMTCFSGDKMLGGGQAGLIVGKADYVKKIKRNPLFRTLRVDKIVFSMLERLLSYYLSGDWSSEIKLWSILSVAESELYARGKEMLSKLGNPSGLSVEATSGFVGGGALPESSIPSVGICFSTDYKPTTLARKFRELSPPIIGRIDDERFILDLRAVDQADLILLEQAIWEVIG